MAIYNVTRTDVVAPGEFVSAVVVAPGKDLARRAVAHLAGVVVSGKGRNIQAEPMDTTGGPYLVVAYHDETPTLDDALSDADAPEYLS
jgi:hypothetical protein